MNAATVKALRCVRWLTLLSVGLCTLYVVGSLVLIYVISPYVACQEGRCYMAHNWDYLMTRFLPWHIVTLTCCVTVFSVIWRAKVPEPDSTPDPVQEDSPSSIPVEWPVTNIDVKPHQNGD